MGIHGRTVPHPVWPALLPFGRVALVGLMALVTMGLLALAGQPSGVEAVGTFSALYLLPVNVITLLVLRHLAHCEGTSLRAMIGFERRRFGRDILWGLLWIVVLYLPFAGAIIGTMFALYGANAFESFDAVFAPDVSQLPNLGVAASAVFGVLVLLTFPIVNAPAEELLFRGYSQARLAQGARATRRHFEEVGESGLQDAPIRPRGTTRLDGLVAIVLPSIAFGIQHMFFASTLPGMVVLGVAFLVWGLGSALIFRATGRLMPLIVAHFLVNLFTSAPALVLPFVVGA